MKKILSYFLFSVLLSGIALGKTDETVVRTADQEYVGDELIMRHYSDGTDTVIAVFTADNDLLECHVEKGNPEVTRALFSQAVANPVKDHQLLVQMDVARLGRTCRKLMRDTKRIPEEDLTTLQKRTRLRLDLDVLAEETNFCARQIAQVNEKHNNKTAEKNENDSNSQSDLDEVKTNVDFCCQAWQQCLPYINGLTIKNHLYNPYFWPMRSCDCDAKLRACLDDLSENAEEKKRASDFNAAYFGELRPKCFVIRQEKKALMIPGLIILLVDHHNRVEEEIFLQRLKKNPNLTQFDANGKPLGPQAQGIGLFDLFRHDHHAEHDHGEENHDKKP